MYLASTRRVGGEAERGGRLLAPNVGEVVPRYRLTATTLQYL